MPPRIACSTWLKARNVWINSHSEYFIFSPSFCHSHFSLSAFSSLFSYRDTQASITCWALFSSVCFDAPSSPLDEWWRKRARNRRPTRNWLKRIRKRPWLPTMRKWTRDLAAICDLQRVRGVIADDKATLNDKESFCIIAGQETLRLFVVVNSLVMFLTIAWPQMKSAYSIAEEFIIEYFGSSELL